MSDNNRVSPEDAWLFRQAFEQNDERPNHQDENPHEQYAHSTADTSYLDAQMNRMLGAAQGSHVVQDVNQHLAFDQALGLNQPSAEVVQPEEEPIKPVSAEEPLYFIRGGVQHKVMTKLKRGQIPIQAEIDLHGLVEKDAIFEVNKLLSKANYEKLKCVRVIHGKSHGALGKLPVLKNMVNEYLRSRDDVLAFCSAAPQDGGTGAVNILVNVS